ncbi:MAG: ABC transporter ATP-binding protein [Bacteroidota bacterium]|nr:ABC transporter ATP-binding protein [Bacteroidota bacterium]
MEKLVEIKNLTVAYENQVVLENVDLEINDLDFLGVIGPNGGGKTTLLKAILGLVKIQNGQVIFPGHTSGVGIVGYLPQLQKIDFKFPITVFDVVRSGFVPGKSLMVRFSKEENKRADQVLEEMGIAHLRRKPVGELSGGQMQRVFLCRALVSSPRLLILDEPNTYVDNKFESELYERLRKLNKEMAIVLVSHDVGTIASYVKTIACVNRNLYYHPSNIITAEQLTSYNCPIQLITHGEIPHTVLHTH